MWADRSYDAMCFELQIVVAFHNPDHREPKKPKLRSLLRLLDPLCFGLGKSQ